MKNKYSIYSDFDIRKHAENFVHYLEVIIEPDGSVHYAIPSHQEYMIGYICQRDGITPHELESRCPWESYFNFMEWLCRESRCLSVWTNHVMGFEPTAAQIRTIELLREKGLLEVNHDC